MKLKDLTEEKLPSVKTPTVKQIAAKHKVSAKDIEHELKMGIEFEKEHTTDEATAREIALDHLNEFPNYYTALDKMERDLSTRDKHERDPRRFD